MSMKHRVSSTFAPETPMLLESSPDITNRGSLGFGFITSVPLNEFVEAEKDKAARK